MSCVLILSSLQRPYARSTWYDIIFDQAPNIRRKSKDRLVPWQYSKGPYIYVHSGTWDDIEQVQDTYHTIRNQRTLVPVTRY